MCSPTATGGVLDSARGVLRSRPMRCTESASASARPLCARTTPVAIRANAVLTGEYVGKPSLSSPKRTATATGIRVATPCLRNTSLARQTRTAEQTHRYTASSWTEVARHEALTSMSPIRVPDACTLKWYFLTTHHARVKCGLRHSERSLIREMCRHLSSIVAEHTAHAVCISVRVKPFRAIIKR